MAGEFPRWSAVALADDQEVVCLPSKTPGLEADFADEGVDQNRRNAVDEQLGEPVRSDMLLCVHWRRRHFLRRIAAPAWTVAVVAGLRSRLELVDANLPTDVREAAVYDLERAYALIHRGLIDTKA